MIGNKTLPTYGSGTAAERLFPTATFERRHRSGLEKVANGDGESVGRVETPRQLLQS